MFIPQQKGFHKPKIMSLSAFPTSWPDHNSACLLKVISFPIVSWQTEIMEWLELRDGAEDVRDTGETWQRSRGGFSEVRGYEKKGRWKRNSVTQDKRG